MILTTRRHGRDRRATKALLAHLSKMRGQTVEIAMISNTVATEPRAALRMMERARDAHARAGVAFHHVTLSPTRGLSEPELREAVARVLDRLGASAHAHVVWRHTKIGEPSHFHIVLGHVGPDGRCVDDGRSFTRLEAAARSLEVAFGERLTHSRRASQVAALLDETEPEVAAAIRAAAPSELPRSAMKSSTRAVAERVGLDLPAAKTKIRALWSQSDNPRAALAALADAGFSVQPGEKAGVLVVKSGDFTVGALDRLAGRRRAEITAAMAQARGEEERTNERKRLVAVENPDNDGESRRPRDRRTKANRRDTFDRADNPPVAPGAARRVAATSADGVGFDRAGIAFSESGPGREEDRSNFAALTTADLVEVMQSDRDPRASNLAARAARLTQPVPSLNTADLVEIARADCGPHAPELVARAARLARLVMLDRREIRARDVLALPFTPPPAPAALAPALAKKKRADEAVALARAVEHEAQIALAQYRARRRPGWLFGRLTGARARYDEELRSKQDAAEMHASQRQRADVAAVIASEVARRLAQQHERATSAARDADERRREQARAQLRWCADARIALRAIPDLAAKDIRAASEYIRHERERIERKYYNMSSPRRIISR